MWFENEESKNMTSARLQRHLEKQNGGLSVNIEQDKHRIILDECEIDTNQKVNVEKQKVDVEMEKVNTTAQKKPVRRYKTRTNSEWQKIYGSSLPKEAMQRMDYVLVYKKGCDIDEKKKKGDDVVAEARRKFLDAMEAEGIDILTEEIGENVYLKLHTPFWRLCKEAEREGLKMPVKDMKNDSDDEESSLQCWAHFEKKYLETDDQDDFVSGPFKTDRIEVFKDSNNADIFFRPALRSLMTYWILVNIDIGRYEGIERNFLYSKREEDALVKQGLLYMLHKKYFQDAFPVHDEAKNDPSIKDEEIKLFAMYGSQVDIKGPNEADQFLPDSRQKINDAWVKFFKYQPLWMIRDYFGEKIGFYFAWCGTLITTLWMPMVFGIVVFAYGLYLSISKRLNPTPEQKNATGNVAESMVEKSMNIVKESFDNDVTPYFAILISLWGTVFLEIWKRTNATLAYEWDVTSFEKTEPDRPNYEATDRIRDPVTGEMVKHSSVFRQMLKYSVSIITLLFMVCLVFIASAAVILYRVVVTIDYCINMSATECLLATAVGSSLLNALAIMVLGRIYDVLAVKLTDWENHRTQTQYNDSLVLKLFAFQFANSYTSLYYIAFFRGKTFQEGIFGLGPQYVDTCGNEATSTCMPMLSFQVLVLMLTKPLPKLTKDLLIPLLKWFWRSKLKRFFQSCCCCRPNAVATAERQTINIPSFLQREFLKSDAGDFTLPEYTEKVIIYGFVMLFAASLPIAPLIALLTVLIDVRIDAKRLLWLNRRPVPFIAQDIGTWYMILNFLNVIGVVSNACLIAFTSTWGSKFEIIGKLLIVIGFEHIVFAVKFLIAAFIPDVPSAIELAMRRCKKNHKKADHVVNEVDIEETYIIQKIMDMSSEDGKNGSKSNDKQRRKSAMSPLNRTMLQVDEDVRSILQSPDVYTKAHKSQNNFWKESRESSPELKSKGHVNFAGPGGHGDDSSRA